jgi:hypothetical protein
MAEDRSLDPRFDPRFQRGFDPATMPVDPAILRAPVEEAGPVPPVSAVLPVLSGHTEPLGAAGDDEAAEDLGPGPGRNPFRTTLLLASIGFLAVAVALLWWTANNQSAYLTGSGVETAQGWMFQAITGIVPPAAIVAGFVGVAIWLGLGALAAAADAADRPGEPGGE